MKKVLWVSRHPALDVQKRELERLLADTVAITQFYHQFRGINEIVREFRTGRYDEMVIVAPMYLISKICADGIHPLWSQMQQVYSTDKAQTSNDGRYYRFVEFKRIKELRFEFFPDPAPIMAS